MTVGVVSTNLAQGTKIVYLKDMENNASNVITVTNDQGKKYISLVQDPAFISAIQGLQSYVLDTNADIDMAYDWICEMADCASFVADQPAWDLFYDMWETTQD